MINYLDIIPEQVKAFVALPTEGPPLIWAITPMILTNIISITYAILATRPVIDGCVSYWFSYFFIDIFCWSCRISERA